MRLKDIRMFCRVCSVEIQLSVFQKTGLMGLHDQYTHVHDICNLCYQKENPDSGTSDSGISLAEPDDGGPNR
jgi:hypothetical protein